jgi:hypothetical protein
MVRPPSPTEEDERRLTCERGTLVTAKWAERTGPPRKQGRETSRLDREAGVSNGLMRFWRSLRASEIGFQIICKGLRPVCPS